MVFNELRPILIRSKCHHTELYRVLFFFSLAQVGFFVVEASTARWSAERERRDAPHRFGRRPCPAAAADDDEGDGDATDAADAADASRRSWTVRVAGEPSLCPSADLGRAT